MPQNKENMRLLEFYTSFPTEESCKKDFKLMREKVGITCKVCGGCAHYWLKSKEMYQCKLNSCRFRTSLKSGTVMENSKLSFHIWYKAMHLITATKNNISAVEVQRQLGIKNYEPVFEMLHKLRLIMGKRDEQYTLDGIVEFDEGFFSNSEILKENEFTNQKEELKRGKGSQKKSAIAVLHSTSKVELNLKSKSKHKSDRKPKFLKMYQLAFVNSKEISQTIKKSISKKAELITDKAKYYNDLQDKVTKHTPYDSKKVNILKVLPWVHKAISNIKGTLWNIYKGVSNDYMQNYLSEYCFKYNRRSFGVNVFNRLVLASALYQWN